MSTGLSYGMSSADEVAYMSASLGVVELPSPSSEGTSARVSRTVIKLLWLTRVSGYP